MPGPPSAQSRHRPAFGAASGWGGVPVLRLLVTQSTAAPDPLPAAETPAETLAAHGNSGKVSPPPPLHKPKRVRGVAHLRGPRPFQTRVPIGSGCRPSAPAAGASLGCGGAELAEEVISVSPSCPRRRRSLLQGRGGRWAGRTTRRWWRRWRQRGPWSGAP